MLIYGDNSSALFGAANYKSVNDPPSQASRLKGIKRRGRKTKHKVKRTKKARKRATKKLSAKNLNFLKKIGLKVRKKR